MLDFSSPERHHQDKVDFNDPHRLHDLQLAKYLSLSLGSDHLPQPRRALAVDKKSPKHCKKGPQESKSTQPAISNSPANDHRAEQRGIRKKG